VEIVKGHPHPSTLREKKKKKVIELALCGKEARNIQLDEPQTVVRSGEAGLKA